MILNFLKGLLGIGGGASVVNTIGGVASNGALAIAIPWVIAHRDEVLHFQQSCTVGTLGVIILGVYGLVELLRRSNPGGA